MKTSRSILVLLVAAATMTACDKDAVQIIAGPPTGGASVKFFNFAVGSPEVNFFVNDEKATAVSSTACAILDETNREACLSSGIESSGGVGYGGAANGGNAWYSDVSPGQVAISGRIAEETDKNLAISNLETSIAGGGFYSYYLSGIYDPVTKDADSFIVEDVMPPVDFSVAYVRFVNASSTTEPMTLYLTDRETLVEVPAGGAIAYRSAGEFVAVPIASYDLATRTAGSDTAVFTREAVSFFPGRAYTITARGDTGESSTMRLDNTANR